MSSTAQNSSILEFSDYVHSRMGLSFPKERWGELEKKVSKASESLGFPDNDTCIEWVLTSPASKHAFEAIAGFLTVGETYFFRESKSLRALADIVFPEIKEAHAQGDHTLRIWSAGCCTGEEPYTIAMMLSGSKALRGWDVKIIATDINHEFLEKAKRGIYSDWSFRGVDDYIKEKYFIKLGNGKYEILPLIKRMVVFSYLNLIEDPYPAMFDPVNAIDLIICRNVLMYFDPKYAKNVVLKFNKTLRQDGWLLVSPVEVPLVDSAGFIQLLHGGAVLNRKARETISSLISISTKAPILQSGITALKKRIAKPQKRIAEPSSAMRVAEELYGRTDYLGTISTLQAMAPGLDIELPVFLLLSRSYANLGMLDEAEHWSLRALESDKLKMESQYLLALIKIEQNKADEAIIILRKLICIEPEFVIAQFMLATLFKNKNKAKRSRQYLNNALLTLQALGPERSLPESDGINASGLIDLAFSVRADRRTDVYCGAAQYS